MLHGFTIFLSAFLLFQIQLVVAKHLLPWFGGTPSVWTTSQVFFQAVLLAGYAYAHGLARERNRRTQGLVHLAVLACAFGTVTIFALRNGVPLLPDESLAETLPGGPATQMLVVLGGCVAFPFLVLSATSPLVQRWYSLTATNPGNTYRLYALSNAGSLLGLVSYPLGVEWMLDLTQQAWVWAALYAAFSVACGVAAWRVAQTTAFPEPLTTVPDVAPGPPERIDAGRWLLWLLLPFVSAALLLSATVKLCQDVAMVPFLWMVPLALYLVTFMVCFDHPRWYARRPFMIVGAVATGVVLFVVMRGVHVELVWQLLGFGVFLFVLCMLCHGELALLRPDASQLTLYYLTIALGGAAGGAFVSLAAPVLFDNFWEFHLTVILGWVVLGAVWWRDRSSPLHTGDAVQFPLVAVLTLFLSITIILRLTPLGGLLPGEHGVAIAALAVAVPGGLGLFWWGRTRPVCRWDLWPRVFVVFVGMMATAFFVAKLRAAGDGFVVSMRNFFGVTRVEVFLDSEKRVNNQLTHGNIAHGLQIATDELRNQPTSYYVPSSGAGFAARFPRRRTAGMEGATDIHYGIVGLGTGTMAAYAQPGDRVRFYEINPLVVALSRGAEPMFTYVRDCRGTVRIVTGDARLELQRELAERGTQGFDVLALDAFSSDSIPIHLITSEAFDVYAAHLRDDDSIIAVHISNRFLDLEPVIATQARRLGMSARVFSTEGEEPSKYPSTWVLLVRNPIFFDQAELDGSDQYSPSDREILFTDRYSNLLRILD